VSAQHSRSEYQETPPRAAGGAGAAGDELLDVLSERVSELVAAAYRMGREAVAFDEPEALRRHLGAQTAALVAVVQALVDREGAATAAARRHLLTRLQWQEQALANAESDVQHLRAELESVAALVGADDPSRPRGADAVADAHLAELEALGVAPPERGDG